MILQWFNARQAAERGTALADKLTPSAVRIERPAADGAETAILQEIVNQVASEVRDLRLNLYQRARLANSFKWRLIENGIGPGVADHVTKSVVVDLSTNRRPETGAVTRSARPSSRLDAGDVDSLFARANSLFAQGEYRSALALYEELLRMDGRNADALNNVGACLCELGRLIEAEQHIRGAIAVRPDYPEAFSNLGNVLWRRGYFSEAEMQLRRAIKANPTDFDAYCSLGSVLVSQGDTRGAMGRFKKVLKAKPRHINGMLGMAHAMALEGHMEDANQFLERVLEIQPQNLRALAAQAGLRKMQKSDSRWLETALASAQSATKSYEEGILRFSIGKYFDDIGDFARAFENYKRANDLFRSSAEPYDRKDRTKFVSDLISAYPRDVMAEQMPGASSSEKPLFIVGMPRSGTSLVDQIICAHPLVAGIGESPFWPDALREHESNVRSGSIDEQLRSKLATSYLERLTACSADTLRVVDKAVANSDHLGVIQTIFPNARFIYLQRDPLDTCISNYFQAFPLSVNFKLDLSDLAHYYREHRRLVAHWRAALPPESLLVVPYEDLVADQESWVRKILGFAGLEWDARCLDFTSTKRVVATASYWQVRQRIYTTSMGRWRNYEKFIGPLLGLREDR